MLRWKGSGFRTLVLVLLLGGCSEPEPLKTVSWKNHGIELLVDNGGATAPFRYLIRYKKNNWSGKKLF